MKITFDAAKRLRTLQERVVDFLNAEQVFEGPTFTFQDTRHDYPERKGRFITAGMPAGRMVIIVWTPMRDDWRHVISMRKANDREQARYRHRLV